MGDRQPRAGYGIAVLTLINFLNFADRFIGISVIPLIERDFGVSHARAGLLGTAFISVYVLALPLTGFLGDRVSRRLLVASCVVLWSAASLFSGLAPSFTALLFCRALLGLGEAGYASAGPAIISDLVPPSGRSRALAVYSFASPLGAAAGYALGGWIGQTYSWRAAFLLGAAPGLVLAGLMAFAPDPARGASERQHFEPVPFRRGLRELMANRFLWLVTGAWTLIDFSVSGLSVWMPSFLQIERGVSARSAGLLVGATTAVAGSIGILGGGALGTVADRRWRAGGVQLAGLSVIVAAPLMFWMAEVQGLRALSALLLITQAFLFFHTAPVTAAICGSVRPDFRALALSLSAFCQLLLGGAFSPPLTGYVGQRWSLERAIQLDALPVLLGGVVLLIAARRKRGTGG